MEHVTVTLTPLGKRLQVSRGTPLVDLLQGFGMEFPCGGRGRCGKCTVRLLKGDIRTDHHHRSKLESLDLPGDRRLACLSSCEEELVLEVNQFEAIMLADESPFDFVPGTGLGVAVDLGTTTVVAQLLDLRTGKVLAVERGMNPQRRYGADLISRLEWALEHGAEGLQEMIRNYVGGMVERLMEGRDGGPERVALVGNTVMQHLFCGSDIRPLAFYPFASGELGEKSFKPDTLGWNSTWGAITFHHSIGSFVGSDILAGILATRIHLREEYTVLVDLGTNGEIVVGNRHRILCASTAAGPAFEGARITMGMTAATGAISSVVPTPMGWECRIIGNAAPRGICGSGLIDAVAVLLDAGQVDQFGLIKEDRREIPLAGEVILNQKDIQEFMLAKAALAAGLEILLERLGISSRDISTVYLAGAFGNYINPEQVVRTGMMDFEPERLHKLGNTALIGAKMLLFSGGEVTRSLLQVTSHVNLESDPHFQERYVRHLRFNLPDPG